MSISRVRVGLPIGGSRFRTNVGMKWEGSSRVRKTSSLKLRQGKTANSRTEPETPVAIPVVPDMVTPPLSFLSIRNFCVLAGLALIVILLILGMVRSNHQAVAYSYEISELTQAKLRLIEANRRLSSELSALSSLPQLEKAALNNLNLIRPRQGQIVVID